MTIVAPPEVAPPELGQRVGRDRPVGTLRRVHLVGVGGSGMRSLARVLHGTGWQVSGSDEAAGALPGLAAAGVRTYQGHAAEHVPEETELVVASDAVEADNAERLAAAARGIPTLSYFQAIGRLMRGRRGLAVAGTHGKSTTTAMAASILVEAGLDPTVLCGAAPLGQSDGGRVGRGDLFLAEACEYRANFLHLCPRNAVITGIEPDHFDCYRRAGELEAAFARFAALLPPEGLLVVRRDCARARQAATHAACRTESFGFEAAADWGARPTAIARGRYRFALWRHGRRYCEVSLRVPGRHNVLNALAAAALAGACGAGAEEIAAGLGRFAGLRRRLEDLGTWRGVTVVDDYAHHPTEVAATLETVRHMYPGRRLVCLFQPHQASRTRCLLDELAASLHNVDWLLLAEIYRAREPSPRPGEITAADLARAVRRQGGCVSEGHYRERILHALETGLEPGDVLVIIGAGDIREVCDGFLQRLREGCAAG